VICSFSVNGSSKRMSVTFGIRPDPITPGTWSDSAEDVVTAFSADSTAPIVSIFAPTNFGVEWSFDGVEVAQMTATGPLVWSANGPGGGSNSIACAPANCSVLMTKRTALGGRKHRGRCYLPPMFFDESQINAAGVFDIFRATEVQDEWDNSVTELTSRGWLPVLHHSDGTAGSLITGVTVSTLIGTQRRRLR